MKVIAGDRGLHWKIIQRGFWTNGAASLSGFLAEMDKWKLDAATVAQIQCPMLVTAAESDMASSNAKDLYDALPVPQAVRPVHERRRRRRPLRDPQPVVGQPGDPRLARRHPARNR